MSDGAPGGALENTLTASRSFFVLRTFAWTRSYCAKKRSTEKHTIITARKTTSRTTPGSVYPMTARPRPANAPIVAR